MAIPGATPFSEQKGASESHSKGRGGQSLGREVIRALVEQCEALEGIRIEMAGEAESMMCGLPADPKSQRLVGHYLCPDHLEMELHGMLGGEG